MLEGSDLQLVRRKVAGASPPAIFFEKICDKGSVGIGSKINL